MRLFLIAMLVLAAGWGAAALAAEAVSRSHGPRGKMVDIGGRALRLVCEGPRSAAPVVWMEAGAFSGAADFAAIQQKLAARHLRSCAYDRAGMGYSDKGPEPRDGEAIAADLSRLMAASGELGPFILMGHSMAGLYLRQFAARNPEKVAGLVLLDAATPDVLGLPGVDRFVRRAERLAQFGAVAGTLGLTKPLYWFGDRIGLPPEGRFEKRRGFISGGQSRAALTEVRRWRDAARQAAAAGPLRPEWPVAVVTAGRAPTQVAELNTLRYAPAEASRYGRVENVDAADHRTLLGMTYGDRAVAGVDHVLRALKSAEEARAPGHDG